MGGLSWGFAKNGFEAIGIDISKEAGLTYSFNRIGSFAKMDLMTPALRGQQEIVIGGPPCEPWSCLNLARRGKNHPRYGCLGVFFRVVGKLEPFVFIMENVPAIKNDSSFAQNLEGTQKKYDTHTSVVKYSDYGTAFGRSRLFAIGIRKEVGVSASKIIEAMEREEPTTVWRKIRDLRNREQDITVDHIWPRLTTIHKYLEYYKTGKYGWYILEWDRPSPSFGNITKTYILHPDSFHDGTEPRAISVREALRIVGFPDDYNFPTGIGMGMKYEMIADAVSPVFSFKLAKAVKDEVLPYML